MKKGVVFTFVFLLFVFSMGFLSAIPSNFDLPDLPPDFPLDDSADYDREDLDRSVSSFRSHYNDNDPSTFTDCLSNISQGQSADPYTDATTNGSAYECKIMGDLTLVKGTYLFNGMVMFAENSILDCNGATLLGSPDPQEPLHQLGSGIRVYGKNNTVKNCNFTRWKNGILVGHWLCFDASNGNTILNNIIRNSSVGIYISSADNEIMYNDIVGTDTGMKSMTCDPKYLKNNFIHNNFIDNTVNDALRAYTLANSTIFNNTLTNSQNTVGIRLYQNENLTISNNNISGNRDYAIRGLMGINLNISNNVIRNNIGITIGHSAISGYGFYYDFPTIIQNNIITDNPNGGIGLNYPQNVIISGNDLLRNSYGVVIYDSGDETKSIEVTNNRIIDNVGSGIVIRSPGDVLVAHNVIINNRVGTFFYSGLPTQNSNHYIYNNTMIGNRIHNFVADIFEDNFIFNPGKGIRNHVYNNNLSGSPQCGIFLSKEMSNSEVYGNVLSGNAFGICLEFNKNNTVRQNTITNSVYGIEIYQSFNNKIFLNNILSSVQFGVWGEGPLEVSYGGIGNYWGRTTPPCFIPGIDSNTGNVNDSYAYCDGLPNNINIKIPTFGWYLFGSNLIPLDIAIENVLSPIAGHVGLVQSFINGNTDQYQPGNPFNDLTGIYPWYGYWMKVTSTPPGDLVIVGNEVNPSSCYRLSLTPTPSPTSWIGYWASGIQPIATALSSIDGNYSLVRTYEDGAWKTYDPLLIPFSDLDFMKPGQGYIITITNPDDLNYLGGFCPP